MLSGASGPSRHVCPPGGPSAPWSRASRLMEPQCAAPGCLLALSPGVVGPCQSGFWTRVTPAAPGPQDRLKLVTGPDCRAKALSSTRRRQAMSERLRG